jgi:hypothetical protein
MEFWIFKFGLCMQIICLVKNCIDLGRDDSSTNGHFTHETEGP